MRVRERIPLPLAPPMGATALPGRTASLPPEEEEGRGGLSPLQIITILRAYWKLSAAIFVVIVCITGVVVKMLPKFFTSSATLMMSYEVNDPVAGKEFPLQLLNSYISTQMEIMQSPEVLLAVVDKLDLVHNKDFGGGFRGDPALTRDWVKEQLQKSVTVTQGVFGSQLINIKASARSAPGAAAIANGVAEVYLAQHNGVTAAPDADRAARYAAHLADLKGKVDALQDKIAKYREDTGVTDLAAANTDGAQAMLVALQTRYQEAQNARRAAEVKLSGDHGGSDQVVSSLLVQNLKGQLAAQESELAERRATLGSAHPRVLELQSQIQATRASIDKAIASFTGSASVELNEDRQLEDKLRQAVAEQTAKVVKLRNTQDEGTNLLLELQSAQMAYKHALDNNEDLSVPVKDSYSNAHLLTRAQPPLLADKPNKAKLFLMGCFAALGVGLIIPAAYELLLNRRIRSRDDIERELGIDVLVELRAIPGHGSAA